MNTKRRQEDCVLLLSNRLFGCFEDIPLLVFSITNTERRQKDYILLFSNFLSGCFEDILLPVFSMMRRLYFVGVV